jgi:hypothetical protein
MSAADAWVRIEEADELREQGDSGAQSWSALQGPMKQLVQEAIRLSPKEQSVLFMGTWLLLPYAKAGDSEAKKIVTDCQSRLDQLGEPGDDVLDLVGGEEAYDNHRASVKSVIGSSSGCAVAVASVAAVAASVSLLAFRLR